MQMCEDNVDVFILLSNALMKEKLPGFDE